MFRVHTIGSASLFIVKRPNGGPALADGLEKIRAAGVHRLVSLLMPDEEEFHDLAAEGDTWRRRGLEFVSVPVADLAVPKNPAEFEVAVAKVVRGLRDGESAGIHCRQSIGRSGLFAAAVLVALGMSSKEAFEATSIARGCTVPLTDEQGLWLEEHESRIASLCPSVDDKSNGSA